MKYNIVLIPSSDEVGRALIDLAKEVSLGKGLKPDYLLKDTKELSIPHASVIQFEIEENLLSPGIFGNDRQNLLELIWQQVCETWQEILAGTELTCTLSQTINYKHDTQGAFAGITWSEIIIDKNKTPLIQLFHDNLRLKLAPFGVKCSNGAGERYNPHFTLYNSSTDSLGDLAQLIKEIPVSYLPILQFFCLKPALGVANNKWEFIKILKQEEFHEVTQAYRSSYNLIPT